MNLKKLTRLVLLVAIFISGVTKSVYGANEASDSDELFQEATKAVKLGNYSKAIKDFQKLALLSEHDAQYNLAVLLKAGKGTPKKYTDSLYWAWLALLGGIEAAEDFSDDLYKLIPEKESEQIRERVQKYLTERINEGNESALMQLGTFYVTILQEQDYLSAYKWFTVAAAIGSEGAINARDDMENELSFEDVINVQAEAEKIFNELPQSIKSKIK